MKALLITALSLALGAASPAFAAAEHHGHGSAAGAPRISLDNGRKWDTDAALREAMGAIRADLAATLPKARALTDADRRALGDKLESHVGYIVANCKLPPAADANLHVIVAELVAAADTLKTGPAHEARSGTARAVAASNLYGQYFIDPGFRPLAVPK